MSASPDCIEVAAKLAEYAAGALDGRERAEVEAHLAVCATCRAEADSFVDVADELLLLAPSAEPPIGFESAVMARIDHTRRRRHRYRTPVLVAAAVVMLVGLGGVIGRITAPSSTVEQTIALRSGRGAQVGTAVVHGGAPGWLFVSMRYPEDWTIRVEVVARDGSVTPVGSVVVRDGQGSFGATSPVPVDQVRVIRMVDRRGRVVCHGELNA
jgi:anti-sigma factor RsiW